MIIDDDHRKCWTCGEILHKSHYYKENIQKYFNCKKCESVRLAKIRDSNRYVQVNDCCQYCCPKCRQAICLEDVYDVPGEANFSYFQCPCDYKCRLRHLKEPNPRTGQTYNHAQALCPWCGVWGCDSIGGTCSSEAAKALIQANLAKQQAKIDAKKAARKVPPLILKLKNNKP